MSATARYLAAALLIVATILTPAGRAATAWDAQDYDLYSGDFNGDGRSDILYIAKDPSHRSGIALSNGSGNPEIGWQSWPAGYLGISWSGNIYNVVVADFNGDGKADIFLQASTPGDSLLLLTSPQGMVAGISQRITNNTAGLTWSGDQHRIVAGDFNGDGRADLFLQATSPAGVNAVMLADASGQFSASTPAQSWNDGYLGFAWASSEAIVFAADLNGDGTADLLLQAKPRWTVIPYDTPLPVPTYPANMNGFVPSQGAGLFNITGVQRWGRRAFGVDWSPLTSNVVVGGFGSAVCTVCSGVVVQGRTAGTSSYLLTGNSTGAILSSGAPLASNVTWTADSYRIIAGNFAGATVGLFLQSTTPAGSDYVAESVTGSTVSLTHAALRVNGSHPFNFEGIGASDIGVFRNGTFLYFQGSTANQKQFNLGMVGDVPLAADYDGDGKTDFALYRPSTAQFSWVQSSNGVSKTIPAGNMGDVPLVGDFDGDGLTDVALFRPDTSQFFYTRSSDNVTVMIPGGAPGVLPVVGDFDGDGKDDLVAFDPTSATFRYTRSSDGTAVTQQLGSAGDIPLAGDFDGDGIADLAVYHSPTSTFTYIRSSDQTSVTLQWGQHTDVPIVGDFDGDGLTDIAVFRPGTTNQFIYHSSASGQTVTFNYGNQGDTPLGERYAPADEPTGLTYTALSGAAVQKGYGSVVPHTNKNGAPRTALGPDSFLPRCAYGALEGIGMLANLASAGFNCITSAIVQSNDQIVNGLLPEALAYGLQVIPEMLINPANDQQSQINNFIDLVNRATAPNLDPALLAWYIEEEPTACLILNNCQPRHTNYQAFVPALRNANTSHPYFDVDVTLSTMLPTYGSAPTEWSFWNTAPFIASNDNYPFGTIPPTTLVPSASDYLQLVSLNQSAGGTPAIWITVQAFAQHGLFAMPSRAQLRAEVFTAFVHGATGILYFTTDSYYSRLGQVIGLGPNPPLCYPCQTCVPTNTLPCGVTATQDDVTASQKLWQGVTALNSEIGRLQNVILGPNASLSYQVAIQGGGSSRIPVRSLMKSSSAGVYTVMVVNVDDSQVNVQFTLPWRPVDLYSIDGTGGRNPLAPYGNTIVDSMEGFGVRIYEFK